MNLALARLAAAVVLTTASLAAFADTASFSRSGTLARDSEIATIDLTLSTVSNLSAWTTSATTGFDTFMSLFSRDTGTLLSFSDDVDNPYPQLDATQGALDAGILQSDLAPGAYRLVVSVTANRPSGGTLADGFGLDGTLGELLQPGNWAAEVRLTEVAPIPEPETWAFFGAGIALVGTIARRRRPAAGVAVH